MISILIPIYNLSVKQLIHDLINQVLKLDEPVEIICLDDGSRSEIRAENRTDLEQFKISNLSYQEMPTNVGRSAIRNRLVDMANHPYVLFLDCDAKIVRDDFLEKYVNSIDRKTVVVGGRIYPPKPVDEALHLHWTYGTRREQCDQTAFQSNNFLAAKEILQRYPFDEGITTYGHEDTLLGHHLESAGIEIKRIDNPVQHDDLIPIGLFLEKQREAISNLRYIQRQFPNINTKLTKSMSSGFRRPWRSGLLYKLKTPLYHFAEKRLLAGSTSLWLLDLYKMTYFLLQDEADGSK